MILLLVMLHTGTMLAVIVYYWKAWRRAWFSSMQTFRQIALQLILATGVTGMIGLALLGLIKHVFAVDASKFEIEQPVPSPCAGCRAGSRPTAGTCLAATAW
jgi:undecaprenyl-diphosphatase